MYRVYARRSDPSHYLISLSQAQACRNLPVSMPRSRPYTELRNGKKRGIWPIRNLLSSIPIYIYIYIYICLHHSVFYAISVSNIHVYLSIYNGCLLYNCLFIMVVIWMYYFTILDTYKRLSVTTQTCKQLSLILISRLSAIYSLF